MMNMTTATVRSGSLWGKPCRVCGDRSEDSDFYSYKSGDKLYRYSECKECRIVLSKEWHDKNEKKRKTAYRNHKLKALYGLTPEDAQNLYERCGGVCGICGRHLYPHSDFDADKKDKACVDHCHKTGAVRGILCGTCNQAIGLLKDDPSLARLAAEYLENNSDRNADN